ncbi:MAG TPA: hypothetical protein QGF58_02550 [Myxococcota bacterium]|nr:hypothetical protein [Myxococcota bacterium]
MSKSIHGGDGRFDIDFKRLWQERQPWWSLSRWLGAANLQVDPHLVVRACEGVVDEHTALDAAGNPLIGTDWTLELSSEDHRSLDPYAASARPAIEFGLTEAARRRGASTEGFTLRFEENPELYRGHGRFVIDPEDKGAEGSETLRGHVPIDEDDPDMVETERAGSPFTVRRHASPVQRQGRVVAELRCHDRPFGRLQEGVRYTLGRRGGGGGSDFISLPTGSSEFSRQHLRLEVVSDQVLVERMLGNPVAVGEAQLMCGKEISVPFDDAVVVHLTNGLLTLTVEKL